MPSQIRALCAADDRARLARAPSIRRLRMGAVAVSLLYACTAHAGVGDNWRLLLRRGSNPYAEYPNFAAIQTHMHQKAMQDCLGQKLTGCRLTQDSYGAELSPYEQVYAAGYAGCSGQACYTDFQWTESYVTNFCPENQVWQLDKNNNPVCMSAVDGSQYLPQQCPWVGRPVNPLTGVQRETIPLGISIGGVELTATYDTSSRVPIVGAGQEWLASIPPSFGDLWQSNFHKRLTRQLIDGAVGSATSGVSIVPGGGRNETMTPNAVPSACQSVFGASYAGGAGADYTSSVDPARQVKFNVDGTVTLLDRRGMFEETYRADGNVAKTQFADGRTLSYTYNTTVTPTAPVVGLLVSIQDQFGRGVGFSYEQPLPPQNYAPPRVSGVTGSDGQSIHVGYDPQSGYLTRVTWPDSNAESFRYELPDQRWAMTSIVDESADPYVTLSYDMSNRATGSVEGSRFDQFAMSYPADPSLGAHWQVDTTPSSTDSSVLCRFHHWVEPASQQLTNPFGQTITMGSTNVRGMPRLASQSQPAGSGCAASTSSQSYDANGNLTSEADFNGTLTCHAYDLVRNLEVVRLEGRPAVKNGQSNACPLDLASYVPDTSDLVHPERKISTRWHPVWALPAAVAEPGKITTWVYNSAETTCAPGAAALPDGNALPLVCSRTEQATSDPTGKAGLGATVVGAPRTWSYAYNGSGQVLTEFAPGIAAGDTSRKTTYVYYGDTSFPDGVSGHTVGDLQSVTKAVTSTFSQTVQYTAYDKAGRLLSSTDANGTVTTMTYWPRGWVKTITVTPVAGEVQSTRYDYLPTGLLHVVTLPDGRTLTYAYDTHRLTDVVDSAGNSVHYTLDNEGHRVGEQVRDKSGSLAATVSRVFDALGRLQNVTGATQ